MAKDKGIGLATPKRVAQVPSLPKAGTDAHYQAKNDMETLRSAEEIKLDPARHRLALGVARQHLAMLQRVSGKAK